MTAAGQKKGTQRTQLLLRSLQRFRAEQIVAAKSRGFEDFPEFNAKAGPRRG
jgi:hypothetical protein